jgi:PAS domain S-box-containing protein
VIELIERPIAILLVDDDSGREVLARRLERQSKSPRYQVRHALSLAAALEALEGAHFDVVLCDYFLDGEKTAKDLIKILDPRRRTGRPVEVVVFSAYEEGAFKEAVLNAGAFWYLTKPVVFSELVHTVETIETLRRARELGETSTKLAKISSLFHSTLKLEEVVQRAVEAALDLGFRRARLYLLDVERGRLVRHAAAGMRAGSFAEFEIPLSGSGLIARIFTEREPTGWSYESSRQFATEADLAWIAAVGLKEVPWLDCPLLVGEQRVGTLAVDCCGAADPSLTPQQRDSIGVLAGLVAQAVNNCRLYEAEARAQASLRQILLEAPDAVMTTTLDGTIDFVSPSTVSILGTPAAQLVRKRAADVYVDPAGKPGSGAAIAKAIMADLRAGRPVSNRRIHVVGPDGRPLALSLSASVLHSRDGVKVGTLGFLKSIGYLEQQFEEYRNLLEGFGYGTVILAPDGTISFLNPKAERLLGRTRANLLGRSFAGLLRSQDAGKLNEQLRDARLGDDAPPLRVEATSATGEVVPIEISLSSIRSGSNLRGFVLGLYDRREQERLIWAGRLAALGEMVGALAHEINNPLNNIVTAVNALRIAEPGDAGAADARESLDIVDHGVRRITALVRRLRRLSRNEPSTRMEIDLKSLVGDFVDFFRRRLLAKHIELAVSLPAGRGPLILGDPVQVEQVLISLLVNAEEALADRPTKRISITLQEGEGGRVQVSVEDSGLGVPAVHRDDIFDLFFTTKSKQGTGFGLSISRAIAREHQGDLRLEEAGPGSGARFVLELPAHGAEKPLNVHQEGRDAP